MKKFLITLALLATLTAAQNSYAQLMAGAGTRFNSEILGASSKALLSAESDRSALASIKILSARMYNNFTKEFPGASSIVISKQKNQTEITCKTDGAVNRLYYNNKGKLEQSIRYIHSNMVPASVINQVKEAYPDYSVSEFAIHVTVGYKSAYLVTIESCNKWKRIKVVDNEMEETESYQKG